MNSVYNESEVQEGAYVIYYYRKDLFPELGEESIDYEKLKQVIDDPDIMA